MEERDYQEIYWEQEIYWDADQMISWEDSEEILQFENNNKNAAVLSIGEEAGKNPNPPESINNDDDHHKEVKNFMKHTESSMRKSKLWSNQMQQAERNKGRRIHSSYKNQQQLHCWRDERKPQNQQQQHHSSYSSSPPPPTYYISCDGNTIERVFLVLKLVAAGSGETKESFTQKCAGCKMDLSSPFEEREDEYYYYSDFQQPILLPDVAVMECGHLFHSPCLDMYLHKDHSTDPPCLFCLGL